LKRYTAKPPAAKPQPAPSPSPTPKPLYGTRHQDPAIARLDETITKARHAAQQYTAERQADNTVHETSSEYAARLAREAETQPEAQAETHTSPTDPTPDEIEIG